MEGVPKIYEPFSEMCRNRFFLLLVTELAIENTLFTQIQRKNTLLPHKTETGI
jgi:hypothetical protein